MKIYLKYDMPVVCKKVLEEQLNKLEITYTLTGFGEVEINETETSEKYIQLKSSLSHYGIDIVESQKSILVQKIKDTIIEMIYMDDKIQNSKFSVYLSEKLNYSFGYLSNVFSEVTFTSIENFIILQKTERAKQMISTNQLSFTEIAWQLNYSSAAHFSTQFKNATGLTPTAFQRIINKRRINTNQPEPITENK